MKIKYILILTAFISAIFYYGCGHRLTPQQKAIINDPTIDQQYKDAMMQKKVISGMPLKAVEATWGPPHYFNTITLEKGEKLLVWKYVPSLARQVIFADTGVPIHNKYVVFADERVSGVICEAIDTSGKVVSRYSERSYNTSSIEAAPTQGLLPPYKSDAYGPGIWSDGTGRPFEWRTQDGESVGIFDVEPDAYGPGIGMDEFGRPVRAHPLW